MAPRALIINFTNTDRNFLEYRFKNIFVKTYYLRGKSFKTLLITNNT